jgi:hypothetical protein
MIQHKKLVIAGLLPKKHFIKSLEKKGFILFKKEAYGI